MLKVPTLFPQVGSYTLAEHEGRSVLARIQQSWREGDTAMALVSLPGRFGAGGMLTVRLAELADPRPLSAAEHRDYLGLVERMLHVKRPSRKLRSDYDALHRRLRGAQRLDDALRAAGLDRIAA